MNIFHVFTKEFREEARYLELTKQMKNSGELKLKPDGESEDIKEKIARLRNMEKQEACQNGTGF
jgi:hypothetical protein